MTPSQKKKKPWEIYTLKFECGYIWVVGFWVLLFFSYFNTLPNYFYFEPTFLYMYIHFYICLYNQKEQNQPFSFRKNETNNSLESSDGSRKEPGWQPAALPLPRSKHSLCLFNSTNTSQAPTLGQTLVRWWGSIDESILFPDLSKLTRK